MLEKAQSLNLNFPFQTDITPLLQPYCLGGKRLTNRLAVHPMEGFDAHGDGSPSELTLRRYLRFARGGSAVIWFEAASICSEGRSNPRQLFIHKKNMPAFKVLVDKARTESRLIFGSRHNIFCVLQLTHSGRYSRPRGDPAPMAAVANPISVSYTHLTLPTN